MGGERGKKEKKRTKRNRENEGGERKDKAVKGQFKRDDNRGTWVYIIQYLSFVIFSRELR